MKKIFMLTVLVSFLACGTSFAIDGLADNAVTATTGASIYGGVNSTDATSGSAVLLGKMSKGVDFVCNYDAVDPVGQGYAISTKHSSGSKLYGSAHDSTAIYFKDVGEAALSTLSAESNNAFTTGGSWTAM